MIIKRGAKRKKGNVPVNAVKRRRESRGKAPLLLNLGITWKWVGSITTWLLYPREWTPVSRE